MRMERQVAREIACDAMNHHTDEPLAPTAEDEVRDISKTLKRIAQDDQDHNTHEIDDIINTIVEDAKQDGFTVTIGPSQLMKCQTLGSLVVRIRNSSDDGK